MNEYRTTMLSIIERLENIQANYDDGDYEACETELKICFYMLDELGFSDNNTELIKQSLKKWSERLSFKEDGK